MPDDITDFGKNIAENIGYMPAVMGAGKAGSGFMDFLGSLFGGAKTPAAMPASRAAQPAAAGDSNFISGLWNAITSGAQGTADAFQQDVDRVKGGGWPTGIAKDLGTALQFSGTGPLSRGMTGLPRIPATRSVQRVFDPDGGWKEINEVITPSMDPIKSLLQGNVFGSEWSDLLMKLLQGTRANAKGGPF